MWESLFGVAVSVWMKQPGVWNWHLKSGGRVLETESLAHQIDDMKVGSSSRELDYRILSGCLLQNGCCREGSLYLLKSSKTSVLVTAQ